MEMLPNQVKSNASASVPTGPQWGHVVIESSYKSQLCGHVKGQE